MTPRSRAAAVIALAAKHLDSVCKMDDSRDLCFLDAVKAFTVGNFNYAEARALKSLDYAVGIVHVDYMKAFDL